MFFCFKKGCFDVLFNHHELTIITSTKPRRGAMAPTAMATATGLRTDLEGGAIATTCWDPVLSRTSHETARYYGKLSIANLETWQVMPTCPAKGIVIWWSASICEGTQRYDSFIRWHHPRSFPVLWSYCFLNPSACRDMLAMASDTSIPSRLEISKKVVQ